MKKLMAIAVLSLSSCVTAYYSGSVSNVSVSSYKKGGVMYKITRTYTSTTKIDTIKTN